MEVLLQTYYIILPIVATSLLGWVGWLLKNQKAEEELRESKIKEKEQKAEQIRKANSNGIMLVLRYMLRRYHTEYIVQEKITYTQYKEWIDLFNAYTALNGNSIAEKWNEDIENLPKCESLNGITAFEAMLKKSIKEADDK